MNVRVLLPSDPEWPQALNELGPHRPPFRLFAAGLPLPPTAKSVAIVGTRQPTAAGLEVARRLSSGLVEAGFAIVSGMAVGIDAVAHLAAIEAGGHTVAVVGCGLDVEYPKRNSRLRSRVAIDGTILGEYPEGTPPRAAHFPERNRIIAGLCAGVIFVEGSLRSGGRITARLALDANRAVFAVPGSVRNPMAAGPNELIRRNQAALVSDITHVCEELAPGLVWSDHRRAYTKIEAEIGEAEQLILRLLDDAAVSPDVLGERLEMAPGRVALSLAKLEVRGLAARNNGGYEISERGARIRREAINAD
jgi:DNA processing protein